MPIDSGAAGGSCRFLHSLYGGGLQEVSGAIAEARPVGDMRRRFINTWDEPGVIFSSVNHVATEVNPPPREPEVGSRFILAEGRVLPSIFFRERGEDRP